MLLLKMYIVGNLEISIFFFKEIKYEIKTKRN